MSATGSNKVLSPPILALGLAGFAVGTSELAVAGVLPALALDLRVDIPTAGLLISAYALGVAIGGPLLSLATNNVSRRTLLFVLLGCTILGLLVCAVAPNYWVLMAGRLAAAASHGLFFGVAIVVATALVDDGRRGSAISIVSSGTSVAALVGLPLGTAIGSAAGWRWTFFAILALTLVAAAILGRNMPPETGAAPKSATRLSDELRPLARPNVYLSFAIIIIAVTGYMVIFAYATPLLTTVTGLPLAAVAILLFASGVGATLGNLIGGRLGDRWPMGTVLVSVALTGAVYVAIASFMDSAFAMTALLFLWSLVAWPFVPPIQARILKAANDAPNFVAALISTAFNIGIALGAWIGSLALSAGWSYRQLPWISLGCAGVALGVALISVAVGRAGEAAPARQAA